MKRRNDVFSQVVVGLFMVTVLLLLGYFTIVVSGVDVIRGKERIRLTVAFDHVGGLKDHDNVMYRGTKVGIVDGVVVTPSNLLVNAYIDSGVLLREGYRIEVCSLSMLGGNYLMLEEGSGSPVNVAGAVLRGETPGDWMTDVSRISRNLKNLTDSLERSGIITNIEAATASAKTIAERIERGEGLLGKLTSGDESIYDDIRATAANAREITAQLNRKKIYDDLEIAIAEFRQVCANISKMSDGVDINPAIDDFRKACANISKASEGVDLKGSIAKAESLLDNLNVVADRIKRGDGTLGKLTADDGLYREINGLIRDVRQVIDNYRDTTPISTFSSLAIGAF